MSQELSFTSVLETAAKLPLVHIDRKKFLTDNLSKVCTTEQLNKALDCGTLQAGIAVNLLDSIANAVINAETLKVTTISAAAGLPGGLAMLATIPADLAQFYGFILRTAQELAYLYGWDELVTEDNPLELDAATESQLILFVGVMSGVAAAGGAVTKLFGEAAMRAVAKKVAAKALTKTWYYPSYRTIGDAVGMSRNTVCKYVRSLEEKGLIRTERTPSFSGMAASETAHCSTRCCHGDMRWSSSISDNWPWPKLPPNVNRYSSNWRSRKTRCMEVRPYDLATAACADRQ